MLDNDNTRSFLQQTPGAVPYLLTYDPLSTGVLDWNQVANAWRHYATTPGIQSGVSEISFHGFWTAMDDSNYLLHIVTYDSP